MREERNISGLQSFQFPVGETIPEIGRGRVNYEFEALSVVNVSIVSDVVDIRRTEPDKILEAETSAPKREEIALIILFLRPVEYFLSKSIVVVSSSSSCVENAIEMWQLLQFRIMFRMVDKRNNSGTC